MDRACLSRSRRRFLRGTLGLAGLGLLSGCVVLPSQGQQRPAVHRIGYLSTNPSNPDPYIEPLRQALRELGWVDGQNLAIEYRYAPGNQDRLPELAADLVRLEVELIHAAGTGPASAAREASATIPIVIATAGDPVGEGLAASLAHPGGNVTGVSGMTYDLHAKRVELLRELFPAATRLVALKNPTIGSNPTYNGNLRGVEAGAQRYGFRLQWAEVRRPDEGELEAALTTLMGDRPDALLIVSDPVTLNLRRSIADLALRHRLPTIGDSRDSATGGMLIGYGPSFEDGFRRSAAFVDKILRGAKPADLPIEQPSRFDFVINLKTAQALSMTIPQSVLQQATELIQ